MPEHMPGMASVTVKHNGNRKVPGKFLAFIIGTTASFLRTEPSG